MKQEIRIEVKPKFVNKYRSGYPLILKEAIVNASDLKDEGALIKLVDRKNQWIGKGYYGKQNKGLGWILSQSPEGKIDKNFFKQKLETAFSKRKKFYEDPETTAFRVFNGEGDGIGGFTMDYFDRYYLVDWYSAGIYEFREFVYDALEELVDFKGIYEKKRFKRAGKYIEDDDFVRGERGEFPLIVQENGANFAVYLNDGPMVGIFLDQREVRKRIRDKYAAGKTVLNTFSYTGVFSVFSALGGAKKTTSVDLANRSREKTLEQFVLNEMTEETNDIIVMDVFNYFKYAARHKLKFDLVILDPPSFARSKKHTFSVTKDYVNLMKEAISITEDDGIIVASTNSSALNMKKFKDFIDKAFKETGGEYEIVEEFSLPDDFATIKEYKEGNYLKVLFVKRK